jgi:peptide/nickel transport system substrate-binding protein
VHTVLSIVMRTPALLLLAGALALAGACAPGDGPAGAAAGGEPQFGGTVVVGASADLQSLNALTSSDANSRMVQQYMLLMPLVLYDENLQPAPWLAERWDTVRVAPDTLELTFHVRRDVRWHDGTPTTAHDVLFTFERALEPATAFPNRASFDLWDPRAVFVDHHTIRFRLRPHAEFLATWYELPIMPAHLLGDVPAADLANHPYGTVAPVGNGPFRFVRRVPNQEWVFEANPDFPEAMGGRPYLDRLVYRVIPEQTTLLTELLTGRIDVYPMPNPNQSEQLERGRGVRLLSSPYRSQTHIGWNTRDPLFRDARVRRALTLAIDRQAILDALLFGHGQIGVSSSTPAHWFFDDDYLRLAPPHDPDGARRLLAEAGWTTGRDGLLRDAQGRPFRFTLVTNHGNDLRRDVGEIVQAQLRPFGIQVEPRSLEWNTLIGMLDGHLDDRGERVRDFQAVTSGWVNSFRKDDAPILHSRNRNGPFQETGFSHPRIDALIDTLNVMTDRAAARPLWEEYHRILIEEAPYTVLHYPNRLLAHRDRVRGVELGPQGDFVSVQRWWVE